MNKELLESKWYQIRQIQKEKFGNLSEEDIQQINGHYDELILKLQQKYGYSREEAEERIRNWNFDRFETPRTYQSEEKTIVKERSHSSFNKLLLWIALPLLLLGSYYFATRAPETTQSPVMTQEQMMAETPTDHLISTDLRNALLSQQNLVLPMENVHISTNNGVVTLSGFVPSADVRDTIVDTARNFVGVKQVVNNLEIK